MIKFYTLQLKRFSKIREDLQAVNGGTCLSYGCISNWIVFYNQTSGISSDIDKNTCKFQTKLRNCVYNVPNDDKLL